MEFVNQSHKLDWGSCWTDIRRCHVHSFVSYQACIYVSLWEYRWVGITGRVHFV